MERENAEATELVQTAKREAANRAQAAENSVERVKAEATAAVNIAQAAVDISQAAEREAKQRLEKAERIAAELQAPRDNLEIKHCNCDQMRTTLESELQLLQTQFETARAQATERVQATGPEAAV